jgi:hypothetical protein
MRTNGWTRIIGKVTAAAAVVLCLAVSAYGQKDAEKKEPYGVMKSVTGEVGGIGHNCIAVVYKHDKVSGDYEIPLTIKEPPDIENVEHLGQIKLGDIVTVKYEQMTETGADGKDIVGEKYARKIIFVRPAPPPKPAPPENALDSEKDQ